MHATDNHNQDRCGSENGSQRVRDFGSGLQKPDCRDRESTGPGSVVVTDGGHAQATSFSIYVEPSGQVKFIWNDRLSFLKSSGQATIKRASHVEPDENCQWGADMSPVGGPVLGPFDSREEALAAEAEWLAKDFRGKI